jgi:hypothetical protein
MNNPRMGICNRLGKNRDTKFSAGEFELAHLG